MKIIDTLTPQEISGLLYGYSVGIFDVIIQSNDAFFLYKKDMALGYYLIHSSNKTVSPAFEYIINNSPTTPNYNVLIGNYIRALFYDKWAKIYNMLFTANYDPLKNIETNEKKTGSNKNTDTYDTVKSKLGTNSDTTTYDTNVEDNGKTGTSETTTRSEENSNDVYGFNSVSPVGDTYSNGSVSETIVGEADKNTSHNIQKKTGTEQKQFGIDESETHTGTDTTDISIDEEVTITSRNVSGSKLITEEIDFRNKQIFFDIVYKDIDSIITIPLYN